LASKTMVWYLVKTARITGWLLLLIVGLFIFTGFALCGKYGVDELLDIQTALSVHQMFDLPLLFLFGAHALTSIYLSLRRWGWIGK
jgi:hypothetical protein